MKQKVLFMIMGIMMVGVGLFFVFIKNNDKIEKIGNTSSKTIEEIGQYILNMDSYEATLSVEVQSNKTINRYQMKQTYQKSDHAKQEILEPESMKGIIIMQEGNQQTVKNTKMNLAKLYQSDPAIISNYLWLSSFIEDYKKDEKASMSEKNGEIILQTSCAEEGNKGKIEKKLYIDAKSANPIRLEVQDMNQKRLVYILYNEIIINRSRITRYTSISMGFCKKRHMKVVQATTKFCSHMFKIVPIKEGKIVVTGVKKMVVKRGDMFYADLSPVIGSEQGGIRPVLIIQNDMGNKYSPTVIAAAITSQTGKNKLPTHIELASEMSGLKADSVVLAEQIRTIDKSRLKEKIGHIDDGKIIDQINNALGVSFGLGE